MDLTHLHLLITHLPIMGSILGAIVLIQGVWSNSSQTKIAAYSLFILSSIGGGIAYLTGEAAEETVERIQGVADTVIEQHEEFAIVSLVALLVLGAASLLGIFLEANKAAISRKYALGLMFLAVINFGLVAWTGYQGGQIRHTEITNITASIAPQNGEQEDND